jgi:AraC family transcriptional regulator of adaptative response/methylated-DNA-[protein]-cysteine methyltransferase
MNDYERIGQVIRFLDQHHQTQPDLARLAAETGLSPFHFHRLFSRWAGVTPKDFLQCLTVAQVKKRLYEGQNALGVALDAGLSGPGRLHDLCVTLEGASPGEIKSGGEGWEIQAGFASSPFGDCLIAQGPRGLCHLSFHEPAEKDAGWTELRSEWPKATFRKNADWAQSLAASIFLSSAAKGSPSPLRTYVRGTPFQLKVWRALLQIPEGSVTTYGRLAEAIGCPRASRAVGTAVGQNSISYLIPCHRVIRSTGIIGDYRWGSVRKKAMLARENVPTETVLAE